LYKLIEEYTKIERYKIIIAHFEVKNMREAEFFNKIIKNFKQFKGT